MIYIKKLRDSYFEPTTELAVYTKQFGIVATTFNSDISKKFLVSYFKDIEDNYEKIINR